MILLLKRRVSVHPVQPCLSLRRLLGTRLQRVSRQTKLYRRVFPGPSPEEKSHHQICNATRIFHGQGSTERNVPPPGNVRRSQRPEVTACGARATLSIARGCLGGRTASSPATLRGPRLQSASPLTLNHKSLSKGVQLTH